MRNRHGISSPRYDRGLDANRVLSSRSEVAGDLPRLAHSVSRRRADQEDEASGAADMSAAPRVQLGSERLLGSGTLKHKRVGVVSNPASVDASFQHVVRATASASGVKLGAIFGPQHGYRADVQDNMIETAHAQDPT